MGSSTISVNGPYFSPSSSDTFIPLALGYTIISHIWVFGILGKRNIATPLPLPIHEGITTNTKKKIAIVTGSNTGIGYETAKRLVIEYGWDVILACRSIDKAIEARDSINQQQEHNDKQQEQSQGRSKTKNPTVQVGKAIVLESTPLDLSDYSSIRSFAKSVHEEYGRIDVLINNAGRNTSGKSTNNGIVVANQRRNNNVDAGGDHIDGADAAKNNNDDDEYRASKTVSSVDLDLMFQSNYLGHFLLTDLLLDKLQDGGKVINLSSVMHHFCGSDGNDNDGDDENVVGDEPTTKIPTTELSPAYWRRRALYHDPTTSRPPVPGVYSASKLAAILHSIELNRRYRTSHNIYSLAVNPGSVNSDIWRGFPGWVRKIFQWVYLTPYQGSTPLVAAAVIDNDELITNNIRYLQPYWVPPPLSSSSTPSVPMWPFQEMLGPYVGYTPTAPRLPCTTENEVLEASKALWTVSEELTNLQYYDENA